MFRNTHIYSNILGQKAMLARMEKSNEARTARPIHSSISLVAWVWPIYVMCQLGEAWKQSISLPPLTPGEDRDLGNDHSQGAAADEHRCTSNDPGHGDRA